MHRFAELGSQVAGVDLVGDSGAGIRQGSILEPAGWADALTGADLVIHTAALISNTAPRSAMWRANVLGAQRALQAAIAAGVPRFVFLSSITVWGDDFPDGVTEEDPPVIQGRPYADSKIAGEAVVLAAHAAGRIDVTVIRPGDIYGPGSRPWVLIPLLGGGAARSSTLSAAHDALARRALAAVAVAVHGSGVHPRRPGDG